MALRGQKEVAVAVAVLRGPPCPPRTNVLPLQFFLDLSVLRGQKRFSPPPFVDRPNYYLERFSSWPFLDKRKLQSPLQFSAALRVLRGQMCCRCSSSCSFVALRGQKEVAVAVAVLRGPPCPPRTKVLPLQFFAVLRGPSRTNVLPLQFSAALRVLRGQMCCRCRSSCSFVALRGQKEVAVAVAVLRGPPCPPWTNVLPLPFFAALCVLRGQMCCRCRSSRPSVSSVDKGVAVAVLRGPSWPFADKCFAVAVLRGPLCPSWTNVLPLQFSAALCVLRGQMCCRCSSSRPSVSSVDKCVAVAVLRGPPCPPRTNVLPLQFSAALRVLRGQMCCRCSSPRPSVSSVDKCVAVAVLRGPPCPPRTNVLPLQFSAAPPWLDQFMIPLISVQTNVNEP